MKPDYYIRLTINQLVDLPLRHEFCEVDARAADGRLKHGHTEWSAAWYDQLISLAWDWALTPSGTIEIELCAGLRGNVMLIDQHGLDYGVQETSKRVLTWIDTLNWREALTRHG